MSSPLVSICCITYNHEKYIRECIEGFLIQKTNFPFEILIFDDVSSDKTQEIINECTSKSNNISLFFQTENQWQHKRYGLTGWLFPAAKGKYIAICEGDDYWTDPYKLQKQVDFLEGNSEYMVAYHRVDVLGAGNASLTLSNQAIEESYSFGFSDSLQGKHGATLSMLFRADVIKQIPLNFVSNFALGDWPLECCCTLLGRGYFLNESMGVYRVHNQGMNNTLKKSDFFNSRIGLAEHLLKLPVSQKYRPLLKKFLFRAHVLKFSYYLQTQHKTTAVKALFASVPYFYMNCLNDDVNWLSGFQIKKPLQKLFAKLRKKLFA